MAVDYSFAGDWRMRLTAEAHVVLATQASKDAWVVVLKSLEKSRCYSCEGFGHLHKDCPTDKRLVILGEPDGVWRSLHNRCLEKMNQKNNKTLQGENLMAQKPRGRKRAMKELVKLGSKRVKYASE